MKSKKVWIGVDNGKAGALVAIDENNAIVEKIKMPMNGKEYDIPEISDWLEKFQVQMVTLENTYSGQFAQAAMKLGFCKGMFEGLCVALRLPYIVVHPKTWQKQIFSGMDQGDTKVASITFAKRMWAKEDWVMGKTARAKKPDDGLTDAACLALYGKTKF